MLKRTIKIAAIVLLTTFILITATNSMKGFMQPMQVAADTGINKPFSIDGTLKKGDQLVVDITIDKLAEYNDDAYLVFQLMDGNKPMLINAISIEQGDLEVTQYFNVSSSNYSVKVFVFDEFNSELELPLILSEPLALK